MIIQNIENNWKIFKHTMLDVKSKIRLDFWIMNNLLQESWIKFYEFMKIRLIKNWII